MFYESIGPLLGGAARVLATDDPSLPLDERGLRERRQALTLLRRIGVIWPSLFAALDEESEILDATLRGAVSVARAHQLIPPQGEPKPSEDVASEDPLERYRRLLFELDGLVVLLHEQGQEDWAQEAIRCLRRGLGDAEEVQGRLVDAMLAA